MSTPTSTVTTVKKEKKKDEQNFVLQGLRHPQKIWANLVYVLKLLYKTEWFVLAVMLVSSLVLVLIPLAQSGVFGKVIDATIAYTSGVGTVQNIVLLIGLLMLSTILPSILETLDQYAETVFRFRSSRKVELHFLEKVASLDVATLESSQYQELYQKASDRGTLTFYQFIAFSIGTVTHFAAAVASLVVLWFIDEWLLLWAVCAAAPSLFVQLTYGQDVWWIWDLNANNRRRYFRFKKHFGDTTSVVELKLFNIAQNFIERIKNILTAFDDELKSIERKKSLFEIVGLIVSSAFLAVGVWRIVSLSLYNLVPIGSMVFAYAAFRGFSGELSMFFRRFGWIAEWSNYINHWKEVDMTVSKILPPQQPYELKNAAPHIEFKNVSFHYDDAGERKALSNISFEIKPGEKLAVVGLSGAGKTTLIKLLCRIYDPSEGDIFVDGKNLKEIDPDAWHALIAILFQDFPTYGLTVKESIALGRIEKPLNMEDVIAAATMAQAHEFIEKTAKQYDQLVWKGFEDGIDFSKGERQRLALARVLYRNAPITILDEPTASVDALSEGRIFETLEQLPNDRTVVLISHRFSTVKNADKILVIEEGQIIESGTHKSLMKKAGTYAQLYNVQAESYA